VPGDSPILAAVADRRLNAINVSCEAEGAFSKLKWVLGHLKTNMHEASLETIMLLMYNSDICESLCGWNSSARASLRFRVEVSRRQEMGTTPAYLCRLGATRRHFVRVLFMLSLLW
jgi:hypothetical protein